MKRLIEALLDVVYPPLCPCCGELLVRGERPLCLNCRLNLPLTDDLKSPADNHLTDKLAGLVPLEKAAAYFTYRRLSPQARLIHEAKYRGRPSIARDLGRDFGRELAASGFFTDADALIPVPLNFWKLCSRGYNQSYHICLGLSEVCDLPTIDALKARRHRSQTRRGAAARQRAVEGVYSAVGERLKGVTHAILVDDICTTGSTLYECMKALHAAAPAMKISVVVLASTNNV